MKLLWVDQPIDYTSSKAASEYWVAAESARTILHDELAKERIPLLRAQTTMIDEVHLGMQATSIWHRYRPHKVIADLGRPMP